ncbi:MAG: hypothetical protein M3Y33_19465, partial [Actinomycetota bacterium]|nr:hypothetical protein [Actinomycetota bacterium]
MSQPGAAPRLTEVYRYVIQAAIRQLAACRARLARCPACEHGDAAAGRLTDVLLGGLRNMEFRDRYQQRGLLCLPHLRVAARRGRRSELS